MPEPKDATELSPPAGKAAPIVDLSGAECRSGRGKRLCYPHPEDPRLCIKLPNPQGGRPSLRKQNPSLFRRLWNRLKTRQPDLNVREYEAYRRLSPRVLALLGDRLPRCYGFIETSLGRGLLCERICRPDGRFAPTLGEYVQAKGGKLGADDPVLKGVFPFLELLDRADIPIYDMNLRNFVVDDTVVDEAGRARIVCVDVKSLGLHREFIPIARWLPALGRIKFRRRAARLLARIRD